MRKISFGKIFLVVFFIAVLSFGLVGCLAPPITTGTAKLIVSGNWSYDIKMDDYTYFSDKPAGTYYITDIIPGNHTFEAIDTWGTDYGYDSETVYIAAGTTTNVYLNPTPIIKTGTLKVTIMDDSGYVYYVYLGTSSSGKYLGATTGSSIYGANSLTISGIPTGYQNIYVISYDSVYSKVSSIYISPNTTNTLYIWVK